MEYKNISSSTADVDTTSRRVKVVISEMGSKDFDDDIIDIKAYDKTIAERGPKGKNLIYHLRDHDSSIATGMIGKFKELYVDNNQLIGVTDIPKTTVGNDTLEMYSKGLINQHSVGFTTISAQAGKEYRIIKEIKLYEGSAVLFGANPNTPTLSVGKSLDTLKEKVGFGNKIFEQFDEIQKEIRSGKYSDETFELLNIRMEQLKHQIKFLVVQSTPAAEKAPAPVVTMDWKKLSGLFQKAPQAAIMSDQDRFKKALAGRLRN